jgi:Zn-dependent peptidase ImmA (M78 family)
VAGEDWSAAEALRPEQRLAVLVTRRFRLAPPVDLDTVAERVADVESDTIPGECDGLVVGLHRPRPLIIVDRWQSPARKRFTLAHELGHVLIPWHVGSNVLCEPEASVFDDGPTVGPEYFAAVNEVQANRFAGELLVPSAWLANWIGEHNNLIGPELVAQLRTAARVSTHVACLRLTGALPAGFVFALVDATGKVVLSGQTAGTSVRPPERGTRLERGLLDQWASQVDESDEGSSQLIWWSFRAEGAPIPEDADPRSPGELLDELLHRHCGPRGLAVRRSLAGIIGAANGEAGRRGATSEADLYAAFRGRFARSRNLPGSMLADPDFDLWLRTRAHELAR